MVPWLSQAISQRKRVLLARRQLPETLLAELKRSPKASKRVKMANSSPLDFFIDGSGAAGSTNGGGAPVSVAAIHSVTQVETRSTRVSTFGDFGVQSGPTTLITASSTGVPSGRVPIAGPPLSPKQVPDLSAGGLSRQSCCAGEYSL